MFAVLEVPNTVEAAMALTGSVVSERKREAIASLSGWLEIKECEKEFSEQI